MPETPGLPEEVERLIAETKETWQSSTLTFSERLRRIAIAAQQAAYDECLKLVDSFIPLGNNYGSERSQLASAIRRLKERK